MKATIKNFVFIIFIYFCLIGSMPAQVIDTLWMKKYGSEGSNIGEEIKFTTSNNCIIIGEQVSPQSENIWLLKTDFYGDTLWTKQYESGKLGHYVEETADGGYIIVGSTDYWSSSNLSDILIIKTDHNGEILWTNSINNGGGEHGEVIKQTINGNFIIAGTYDLHSQNIRKALVAKIDSLGEPIWINTFGDSTYLTEGTSLALTSNEEIILIGVTDIDGSGAGNLFIKKLDTDGNVIWDKKIEDYFYSQAQDIELTEENDIIISGSKKETAGNLTNGMILKYNENGDELWRAINDDYARSGFVSVAEMNEEIYILTGYAEISGILSLFVQKVDSSGNFLDDRIFNFNSTTVGHSITKTLNGFFAITGYTLNGNSSHLLVASLYDTTLEADTLIVLKPNGGEEFEGTTINDISFISTGVDSVMVHYSSNAGTSWELAYSSIPATGSISWIVPNINSENCLIKLTDTQISNTTDISDSVFSLKEVGWYRQYSNTVNQLYSNDMWNEMVGYACGSDGIIIKTTNGGDNWESLSTGISEDLNSINFISENTGWIAGNNGRILQTTTGGLNWNYQISGVTNNLKSVYFINQDVGWTVGTGGVILKTTDSGINWTTQQSNVANPLLAVYFYSSDLGWIVGNSGTYLKTTNGGTTWIQKTSGTTGNLYSVLFINDSTGFLVGENGTILRCDDSGEIWTSVLSGGGNWNSVAFANEEIGYVVGTYGRIYKSTDSGYNWFRIGSGLQEGEELFEVNFIDVNTGWAVGESGTIIKTVTGSSGYATTTLIANASALNQTIEVSTTEGFSIGDNILINPGGVTQETNKIIGFGSILLELPLQYDHQIGELVINLKPTTVEEEIINELPIEYNLLHNYPNPFNPTTKIRYSIPQLSNVAIKIFDVLGREIETLINEEKPAGTYEITWYPEGLPSGVYFYQLKAEDFIQTKKMILLK